MKIFFDTEFTGLHKNTTLISIGMIDENGRMFYAELSDCDNSQIDNWLKENVIDKLYHSDKDNDYNTPEHYHFGNREFVQSKLTDWLSEYDTVEWVSDVCHYDFVLLIDLLYGHALNMPYGKHSASCHDINQDIAKFYGCGQIKAFDYNREEIICEEFSEANKHNALHDAIIIKKIYNMILGSDKDERKIPEDRE